MRVEGAELIHAEGAGERRVAMSSLAAAAGAVAGLLPAGAELGDQPLEIDPAASRALGDWYGFAAAVLAHLGATASAFDAATPARLWPEHFDIAIELGAEEEGVRANYGASPGDDDHPEPYLYVGPWTAEVEGDLWRATGFKGAELTYAELLEAPDQAAAALDFFVSRKDALAATARRQA